MNTVPVNWINKKWRFWTFLLKTLPPQKIAPSKSCFYLDLRAVFRFMLKVYIVLFIFVDILPLYLIIFYSLIWLKLSEKLTSDIPLKSTCTSYVKSVKKTGFSILCIIALYNKLFQQPLYKLGIPLAFTVMS